MSVQWGAWSGVGMVASNKAVLARMDRSGIASIAPSMGLEALSAVLSSMTAPAQVHPARVLGGLVKGFKCAHQRCPTKGRQHLVVHGWGQVTLCTPRCP